MEGQAREGQATEKPSIRAAQYVRMSTDHQRYSTENQADVIRGYAARRGYQVVRTFADSGKSGLKLDGREGLQALLDVVQRGEADFKVILVYDVSRWGRFQDADESAYYEYLCKRAGLRIEYCAEQFENDGSPVSTIVKGVKRAMAGEYSRELSAKVFKGQCKVVELGFRNGGSAGYGMRRLLVDQAGKPKGELAKGEWKSLQTDRIVLVPGPPEEQAVVKRIFRRFVQEGDSPGQIAAALNEDGVPTGNRRPWSGGSVRRVLMGEKYIGNNVYNRQSCKLKGRIVNNPPEMWVRRNQAFPAVIDAAEFAQAQKILAERQGEWSDEELLTQLRDLAAQHGRLSTLIIDEAEDGPSTSVYRRRFGGLRRAYELIAYRPELDLSFVEVNRRLRSLQPALVAEVLATLQRRGGCVVRDPQTDLLEVNGMLTVSVVVSRCRRTPRGSRCWWVRVEAGLVPDVTVAIRLDAANAAPLDYYVLPNLDLGAGRLQLREENSRVLDGYRHDSLDYVSSLSELVTIGAAA